jgi:hypothetical protein
MGVVTKWIRLAPLAGALAMAAGGARAHDVWEDIPTDDDSVVTVNTLSHGIVQQHDLQQVAAVLDRDWFVVPTIAGHSYEARISGGNVIFDPGNCPSCVQFERMTAAGVLIQEDAAVVNEGSPTEAYDRRSAGWRRAPRCATSCCG